LPQKYNILNKKDIKSAKKSKKEAKSMICCKLQRERVALSAVFVIYFDIMAKKNREKRVWEKENYYLCAIYIIKV